MAQHGLRYSTNFSPLRVAEMLIPRPKIHSLDRILSRGQTLEYRFLVAMVRKLVAVFKKLVAVVKKLAAAVKN